MALPLVIVSGFAPTASIFELDDEGVLTLVSAVSGMRGSSHAQRVEASPARHASSTTAWAPQSYCKWPTQPAAFRTPPFSLQANLGSNPSYLALDVTSHRATLYVVQEDAPGRLIAHPFDTTTGRVGPRINDADAAGDIPCHITARDGRVYTSNYSSRGVTVYPVDAASGALGAAPSAVLEHGEGGHAHQAVLSPDGRTLYCPFLGRDAVYVYSVDADSGALTPHPTSPKVTFAAGSGPRHLVLDAARGVAYVINELDCTIGVVRYDVPTGALEPAPFFTVSTLPSDVKLSPACSTAHVVVSPDGAYVYGSNRCGEASSLVTYRVDFGGNGAVTGLTPIGWETDGGAMRTPRDFTLSPDGAWLVCAMQGSDAVVVYKRDAVSGLLTKASAVSVEPGSKPCCVLWVQR